MHFKKLNNRCQDLAGMSFAVSAASPSVQLAEKYGITAVQVNNLDQVYLDLANGE
jgi:hypothetical protein